MNISITKTILAPEFKNWKKFKPELKLDQLYFFLLKSGWIRASVQL